MADHSKRGPDLLAKMASGEIPITHAAFADLPADRAAEHIHDLLVTCHILPVYHRQLERITPWLDQLLTTLPHGQADIVGRYAKWHVIRRARLSAARGNLTRDAIQGARSKIRYTLRFLDWLATKRPDP